MYLNMHDYMTPGAGEAVYLKGWEVAGISGAVKKVLKNWSHLSFLMIQIP